MPPPDAASVAAAAAASTAASPSRPGTEIPILSGSARSQQLIALVKVCARRFHRVRIDPADVTKPERDALTRANVSDPIVQSFLAWRRSLLLAIVTFLVPLLTLEIIALFAVGSLPPPVKKAMTTFQGISSIPILAELGFGVVAVLALRTWTDWRRTRRLLAIAWLAMFAAPVVIFLYPLRTVMTDAFGGHEDDGDAKIVYAAITLIFTLRAFLLLLPRVLALLPGLVRGAQITKHLFPGHTAPGWLLVAAAPLFALLVYLAAIIPYQVTGSGFFVIGILGLGAAELFLVRAGFALARPLTREQLPAAGAVHRRNFLIAMGVGALFFIIGTASLSSMYEIKAIAVIAAVVAVPTHIAIATLVSTDGLLVALDHARTRGPITTDAERDLARFSSTPPA